MNFTAYAVREMGMRHAYPSDVFEDTTIRQTVQAIVCCHNKVVMTRPTAAPKKLDWWVFPQDGIEATDENLSSSLARGIYNELGVVLSDDVLKNARPLGSFTNPLPFIRVEEDGCTAKHIIVVGVKVENAVIELNRQKNRDFQWVSSWEELDFVMATVAERRIRKYVAACKAVMAACKEGLLSWEIHGSRQRRLFA